MDVRAGAAVEAAAFGDFLSLVYSSLALTDMALRCHGGVDIELVIDIEQAAGSKERQSESFTSQADPRPNAALGAPAGGEFFRRDRDPKASCGHLDLRIRYTARNPDHHRDIR